MSMYTQASNAIARIESFHPTGDIAVGSATHGGPLQYGKGCTLHGAWCPEWFSTQKHIAVLKQAIELLKPLESTDCSTSE